MANNELIVEKVWSYPEWSAHYLERCAIYLQIRNKTSHAVQIEKVECHFQFDEGGNDCIPSITPRLILPPNHLSDPIRIEFQADLSWKAHTNTYRFKIYYSFNGPKEFEHIPARGFLVFTPLGKGEKQFFISHKDPEDTSNARTLRYLLGKVGFKGYLAEDDQQPGVELWETKIQAEIGRSDGVIIIWTKNAARNPKSIRREVKLAKQKGKHLLLVLDYRIKQPSGFPRRTEYYRFKRPITAGELKGLACSIAETDRRGGYAEG